MQSIRLNDEQISLATLYREKWQSIEVSTEPINQEICTELIEHLYGKLKALKPEIVFFKSPYEALKNNSKFINRGSISYPYLSDFEDMIWEEIWVEVTLPDTWSQTKVLLGDMSQCNDIFYSIIGQLKANFKKLSEKTCREWQSPPRISVHTICRSDFLISTFGLNIPSMDSWELFKSLNEQMGWYNPLDGICIVCDRPRIMNFDENKKLHMDGAPAVEYADGFSVYAFHGTVLPKKYGEIPSNKWDPCWLLEKTSDKMRRTLLSGMSFESIRDTLNLKEIDSSKEYRLWTVENETKGKPIVLLTKDTDQEIVTDSVAARLKKVKKAVEWLHLRYCQEDMFDGD